MKIRPVGAELLHADKLTDGRTDTTKIIVAFPNFAKALKNECWISEYILLWENEGTGE